MLIAYVLFCAVLLTIGSISIVRIAKREDNMHLAYLRENEQTIAISSIRPHDRVLYVKSSRRSGYWLIENDQFSWDYNQDAMKGGRLIVSDKGFRVTRSEIKQRGIKFESTSFYFRK